MWRDNGKSVGLVAEATNPTQWIFALIDLFHNEFAQGAIRADEIQAFWQVADVD